MKKSLFTTVFIIVLIVTMGFSSCVEKKPEPVKIAEEPKVCNDTLPKLTLYKKDVLTTYYADKFNGRKTSSGERFDNTKYTAAHMKLPFGTVVRFTKESNGKWVVVKINDRGPFSKKLEIDITKKAFMEIAPKKSSGTFKVKIEIVEEAK